MNLPTSEDVALQYRLAPKLPLDLQGWHHSEVIFEQVISAIRPRIIIEVGSWKGASAVHMAQLALPRLNQIFCIDFFHTTRINNQHDGSFDIFLSNIVHCQLEKFITPIRGHSAQCADIFPHHYADLIYIDAGHTEEECYGDLVAYWPLLRAGGIMLGDDLHEIPTVKLAVERFCRERGLQYEDCHDLYHYRINKP